MKKLWILCSFLFLASFANANTTVNATITDGTGQIFALGTYQADYIRPASNQGTVPKVNGIPITEHGITGTLNIAGTFSVSLPDVAQILPSGGQWEFTICPNASSQCSVIDTGSLVTGGSVDLSSFLSARVVAPVVNPSTINRAYKDSEVISTTGTFYYDVTLNCIKFNNGSGWGCVGTGGGGGTPGTPVNTLQWNNAGVFDGTADANDNAATTYDVATGRVNPCNIDNVRYASCYNWIQSPSGTLTGGTPATVTLTPGPRGIDTSNNTTFPYSLYIAGVGTPEAVVINGGSCTTTGSSSCTITFTPINSHGAGYTIQSATAGFAEAERDALGTNGVASQVKARPAGAPGVGGNNAFVSIFYAPWFIHCADCLIDGGGATLVLNNKRAVMVIPSPSINTNVIIQNFRILPMYPQQLGAVITNTQCVSNTVTITSTLNPPVGDVVDVQFTNDSFYWGPYTVTSTSPTQWTYTKTCTSKPSLATPGMNNYQMAAIENNGQDVELRNIDITFGGSPYNTFYNNGIVVFDDQHAVLNHITTGGHFNCSTTYCGSAIYAPGDFNVGPAVMEIVNGSINPGCSANGLTLYNGNSVNIINTIIQGTAMWGIRGGTTRGGFGGLTHIGPYHEIGSCTNPVYTPNQQAGYDWAGQPITVIGGEGPQGLMPTFCTGGATTYYYYMVARDSILGPSAPIYIGSAAPTSTCTIKWPRASDSTLTTYDILRSTDVTNAPTTNTCLGGSVAACGSRIVGQAQCNALQCTFTDDISLNTAAYTVLLPELPISGVGGATYTPLFNYFPGNFVLQAGANLNYQGGNVNSSAVGTPGGVVAINGLGPVYTDSTFNGTPRSYIRVLSSKAAESQGNSMLKLIDPAASTGVIANAMGKIGIINPVKGTSGHLYGQGAYLITLSTPKSDEVIASPNPRLLTADPNDSGIALDQVNSNPALLGLAYTAPVSLSNYIGTLADGTSYKERLTTNLREFAVPTQFNLPMLSYLGCTDCGPFNRTFPFINDPLQTPPSLNLAWTTLLGTWTIGSGSAFASGNYAYASALTNEGGVNRAYAYYAGTVFNSNQIVQVNMTPTNSFMGVCVRMQNSTPITAYCFNSGSNQKTLNKYVAGTPTVLFTAATNVPSNSTLKLTAIGSTINVYINGVIFASVTDTAITGGAPGLYVQNQPFSTQGIRNFYATSAGYTDVEDLTMANITAASGKFLGPTGVSTGTVSNTDLNGILTFSGATTSSTYNFAGSYANHPVCTFSPEFDIGSTNRVWWSTITVATIQLTSNASLTGSVDYHCIGRN